MDIGQAVRRLKSGDRIARAGWNGKGMYLELQVPDEDSKMTLPYDLHDTAQGDLVPWLCSQTDLLATTGRFTMDKKLDVVNRPSARRTRRIGATPTRAPSANSARAMCAPSLKGCGITLRRKLLGRT